MRVEELTGVSLFTRTTRNVSVTKEGREFVALGERLLNELKVGMRSIRDAGGESGGQIVIASVMSVAQTTLPGLIAEFCRHRPTVEVLLKEGVQGLVTEEVRSGVADFGIGYVGDLPRPLQSEILRRETFHVILPADHPLAKNATVRFSRLREERLIAVPAHSSTRRIIDGAAAQAGFSPRYVVTVNQFATLYQLVRARAGLTIVPSAAFLASDDSDLVARPLSHPRISRDLGVISLHRQGDVRCSRGAARAPSRRIHLESANVLIALIAFIALIA